MPGRRALPLVAAGLALLAGCAAVTPAAAIVNGRRIPEDRVQGELDAARADPNFQELVRRQGDEYRGTARRNVLTAFIQLAVEEQAAARLGVRVTDKEVDDYLDELRRELGGERAFRQRLEEANLTVDRARELARRRLVQDELRRVVTKELSVSDDKVQAFYDQNQSAFTEIHLARIVVADQQEAQGIADQASGGADFAALARDRSKDPSAAQGGDLGYVPVSELDARTASQLEPVPVGGVAGPSQLGNGYAVYKVLDRRPRPLAEVRKQIEDQLLAQDREGAYTAWKNQQLQKARVRVNPKYGRFDREQLQVVAGSDSIPR